MKMLLAVNESVRSYYLQLNGITYIADWDGDWFSLYNKAGFAIADKETVLAAYSLVIGEGK